MEQQSELRIPALEISQGENRRLYSFAVDGKLLPRFTTVSRVRRENGGDIQGYQRPEVISHISEIRNYLESEDPMIPNALVVSFDQRVRFEPTKENGTNGDHAMSETAHDVLLRAGISRYQVTQRGDHKVQITITTPFTTLMGVGLTPLSAAVDLVHKARAAGVAR